MDKYEDAERALAMRLDGDLSDLEVVSEPRDVSFVQSVALPSDMTRTLFEEAERRNVAPDELIREFIAAGLGIERFDDKHEVGDP